MLDDDAVHMQMVMLTSWAARHNTWLLIKLTPKGLVPFSFFFFPHGPHFIAQRADAVLLQVSASSPVCRNTDPKAVVSGNFLRMNFAGPCTVEGQAQTWWQVDLGEQHCLTCNYYTLRQDGSQDFVRNWVMQVSLCCALLPMLHDGACHCGCIGSLYLSSLNERLQICIVCSCAKLACIGGAGVYVIYSLHDCVKSCAGIK